MIFIVLIFFQYVCVLNESTYKNNERKITLTKLVKDLWEKISKYNYWKYLWKII